MLKLCTNFLDIQLINDNIHKPKLSIMNILILKLYDIEYITFEKQKHDKACYNIDIDIQRFILKIEYEIDAVRCTAESFMIICRKF